MEKDQIEPRNQGGPLEAKENILNVYQMVGKLQVAPNGSPFFIGNRKREYGYPKRAETLPLFTTG